MGRPARRVDAALRAPATAAPGSAFYYARAPWPEVDFGGHLDEVIIYEGLEAFAPAARQPAARGLLLPHTHMHPRRFVASPITGMYEPQGKHPHLDLYLPSGTLAERRFDEETRAAVLVTLPELHVPASSAAARAAAFRTLARLDPAGVLNVLLQIARDLELSAPDDELPRQLIDVARWPAPVAARLRAAVGTGRPWLHALIIQQLILEVAAARRRTARAHQSLRRLPPPRPVDTLVEGTRPEPVMARLLRAVFAYHSGYVPEPDSPAGTDERRLVEIVTTSRVRHQPFEWHDERILLAARQYGLDPNDPYLNRHADPSLFADTLRTHTGMSVNEFAQYGGIATLAVRSINHDPEGVGAGLLSRLPSALREKGAAAHSRWMTVDSDRLGDLAVAVARKTGGYAGWGSIPDQARLLFDRHPFVDHGSNRHLVSLHAFAEAWSRLPERIAVDTGRLTDQQARTQLGWTFETVLTHDLLQLHGHRSIVVHTGAELAKFFGHNSHSDGILSDAGDHLIVEFYGGRPSERAEHGEYGPIRNLLRGYADKLRQARKVQQRLPDFLEHAGHRRHVRQVACLVVVRDPLPFGPVYDRIIDSFGFGVEPRFFCSPEEFRYLLDLGAAGGGVPAAVAAWQNSGLRMPLGRWLQAYGTGQILDVYRRQMERSARLLLDGLDRAA